MCLMYRPPWIEPWRCPGLGYPCRPTQQDDDVGAATGEVNPVARAVIDASLADAAADWPDVAEQAKLEAGDSFCDMALCLGIAQRLEPGDESGGRHDIDHL